MSSGRFIALTDQQIKADDTVQNEVVKGAKFWGSKIFSGVKRSLDWGSRMIFDRFQNDQQYEKLPNFLKDNFASARQVHDLFEGFYTKDQTKPWGMNKILEEVKASTVTHENGESQIDFESFNPKADTLANSYIINLAQEISADEDNSKAKILGLKQICSSFGGLKDEIRKLAQNPTSFNQKDFPNLWKAKEAFKEACTEVAGSVMINMQGGNIVDAISANRKEGFEKTSLSKAEARKTYTLWGKGAAEGWFNLTTSLFQRAAVPFVGGWQQAMQPWLSSLGLTIDAKTSPEQVVKILQERFPNDPAKVRKAVELMLQRSAETGSQMGIQRGIGKIIGSETMGGVEFSQMSGLQSVAEAIKMTAKLQANPEGERKEPASDEDLLAELSDIRKEQGLFTKFSDGVGEGTKHLFGQLVGMENGKPSMKFVQSYLTNWASLGLQGMALRELQGGVGNLAKGGVQGLVSLDQNYNQSRIGETAQRLDTQFTGGVVSQNFRNIFGLTSETTAVNGGTVIASHDVAVVNQAINEGKTVLQAGDFTIALDKGVPPTTANIQAALNSLASKAETVSGNFNIKDLGNGQLEVQTNKQGINGTKVQDVGEVLAGKGFSGKSININGNVGILSSSGEGKFTIATARAEDFKVVSSSSQVEQNALNIASILKTNETTAVSTNAVDENSVTSTTQPEPQPTVVESEPVATSSAPVETPEPVATVAAVSEPPPVPEIPRPPVEIPPTTPTTPAEPPRSSETVVKTARGDISLVDQQIRARQEASAQTSQVENSKPIPSATSAEQNIAEKPLQQLSRPVSDVPEITLRDGDVVALTPQEAIDRARVGVRGTVTRVQDGAQNLLNRTNIGVSRNTSSTGTATVNSDGVNLGRTGASTVQGNIGRTNLGLQTSTQGRINLKPDSASFNTGVAFNPNLSIGNQRFNFPVEASINLGKGGNTLEVTLPNGQKGFIWTDQINRQQARDLNDTLTQQRLAIINSNQSQELKDFKLRRLEDVARQIATAQPQFTQVVQAVPVERQKPIQSIQIPPVTGIRTEPLRPNPVATILTTSRLDGLKPISAINPDAPRPAVTSTPVVIPQSQSAAPLAPGFVKINGVVLNANGTLSPEQYNKLVELQKKTIFGRTKEESVIYETLKIQARLKGVDTSSTSNAATVSTQGQIVQPTQTNAATLPQAPILTPALSNLVVPTTKEPVQLRLPDGRLVSATNAQQFASAVKEGGVTTNGKQLLQTISTNLTNEYNSIEQEKRRIGAASLGGVYTPAQRARLEDLARREQVLAQSVKDYEMVATSLQTAQTRQVLQTPALSSPSLQQQTNPIPANNLSQVRDSNNAKTNIIVDNSGTPITPPKDAKIGQTFNITLPDGKIVNGKVAEFVDGTGKKQIGVIPVNGSIVPVETAPLSSDLRGNPVIQNTIANQTSAPVLDPQIQAQLSDIDTQIQALKADDPKLIELQKQRGQVLLEGYKQNGQLTANATLTDLQWLLTSQDRQTQGNRIDFRSNPELVRNILTNSQIIPEGTKDILVKQVTEQYAQSFYGLRNLAKVFTEGGKLPENTGSLRLPKGMTYETAWKFFQENPEAAAKLLDATIPNEYIVTLNAATSSETEIMFIPIQLGVGSKSSVQTVTISGGQMRMVNEPIALNSNGLSNLNLASNVPTITKDGDKTTVSTPIFRTIIDQSANTVSVLYPGKGSAIVDTKGMSAEQVATLQNDPYASLDLLYKQNPNHPIFKDDIKLDDVKAGTQVTLASGKKVDFFDLTGKTASLISYNQDIKNKFVDDSLRNEAAFVGSLNAFLLNPDISPTEKGAVLKTIVNSNFALAGDLYASTKDNSNYAIFSMRGALNRDFLALEAKGLKEESLDYRIRNGLPIRQVDIEKFAARTGGLNSIDNVRRSLTGENVEKVYRKGMDATSAIYRGANLTEAQQKENIALANEMLGINRNIDENITVAQSSSIGFGFGGLKFSKEQSMAYGLIDKRTGQPIAEVTQAQEFMKSPEFKRVETKSGFGFVASWMGFPVVIPTGEDIDARLAGGLVHNVPSLFGINPLATIALQTKTVTNSGYGGFDPDVINSSNLANVDRAYNIINAASQDPAFVRGFNIDITGTGNNGATRTDAFFNQLLQRATPVGNDRYIVTIGNQRYEVGSTQELQQIATNFTKASLVINAQNDPTVSTSTGLKPQTLSINLDLSGFKGATSLADTQMIQIAQNLNADAQQKLDTSRQRAIANYGTKPDLKGTFKVTLAELKQRSGGQELLGYMVMGDRQTGGYKASGIMASLDPNNEVYARLNPDGSYTIFDDDCINFGDVFALKPVDLNVQAVQKAMAPIPTQRDVQVSSFNRKTDSSFFLGINLPKPKQETPPEPPPKQKVSARPRVQQNGTPAGRNPNVGPNPNASNNPGISNGVNQNPVAPSRPPTTIVPNANNANVVVNPNTNVVPTPQFQAPTNVVPNANNANVFVNPNTNVLPTPQFQAPPNFVNSANNVVPFARPPVLTPVTPPVTPGFRF